MRGNAEYILLGLWKPAGENSVVVGPIVSIGGTPVVVPVALSLPKSSIPLPWNDIDLWHFHDDFHLLICATQVCTALIATRLAA